MTTGADQAPMWITARDARGAGGPAPTQGSFADQARAAFAAMTAGQRQTAPLILLLVIALIAGGGPRTAASPTFGVALPPVTPTPIVQTPVDGTAVPGPTPTMPRPAAAPVPAPPPPSATPSAPPPTPAAPPTTAPAPDTPSPVAAPPRVVALVRPAGAGQDASEADVAGAFAANADLPVDIVTVDDDVAATCTAVAGRGEVVVASTGLGPELTACLVGKGIVVVAHDHAGTGAPVGTGQLISTRRGVIDSIADTARWGRSNGTLDASLGLVTTESRRADVESARDELAGAGAPFDAVAFVSEANVAADVADGVLAFRNAGVDVVVFAAPMETQLRWLDLAQLMLPGSRYVVVDTDDSVTAEAYPATFEGAVGYTTRQGPWSERAQGPSEVQQRCTAVWETAAAGVEAEPLLVGLWCQHTALVAQAIQAGTEAGFAPAVRGVLFASPVTSGLGALGVDSYGPTQNAEIGWESDCTCWNARGPFEDRAP